ncbi:proteasome ATPase [Bifidobacterium cuniculi]|uniref:ATPase AAA n=1 Tax=Bifidobacterium cuniculi TaxID=1688 RepID=A0A087AX36_9BIFI|nr:proteasome ATPase [Bifidobacterium cuniculi]KFI63336.1 ATPase AAA [Bifidobacterium cuniculi]
MDDSRTLAEENDQLRSRNHALAKALTRATEELAKAKGQLERFTVPPLTFATMLRLDRCTTDDHGVQQARAEVVSGNRRILVAVDPRVQASRLAPGMTVTLNENLVLVGTAEGERHGVVRTVDDVLDDGRLLVRDTTGTQQLVDRTRDLRTARIRVTDRVLVDAGGRFALQTLPVQDDKDLLLEETPDISFADIGGLDAQIDAIRDAVQLPFTHRALYARYDLAAPKGILLYGPPGNGKTLIAKAVAHALAQWDGGRGVFLSVKGPELLNKYVGESERLIRRLFARARERAGEGHPVIVFIDEMDSLLRTRGSGISSDVETTIVPQFLAELDGMERLDNVMVIGASNRVDMIDPAVLRPGRLDMLVHVARPDAGAARAIASRYLTDRLPLTPDAATLVDALVDDAYAREPRRLLARMRDEDDTWSPLYLADVMSGAMVRNIVDRAKTQAVKASIDHGDDVCVDRGFITGAVEAECRSMRDTLADVDAGQWARINGIGNGRMRHLRVAERKDWEA